MVKIEKEIKKDWYLIHLEGTNIYQIWNKWDLFELLMENGQTILDIDSLNNEKELNKIFQKMKEIKEFDNKLNKL
jgi:hypothetical protein